MIDVNDGDVNIYLIENDYPYMVIDSSYPFLRQSSCGAEEFNKEGLFKIQVKSANLAHGLFLLPLLFLASVLIT